MPLARKCAHAERFPEPDRGRRTPGHRANSVTEKGSSFAMDRGSRPDAPARPSSGAAASGSQPASDGSRESLPSAARPNPNAAPDSPSSVASHAPKITTPSGGGTL